MAYKRNYISILFTFFAFFVFKASASDFRRVQADFLEEGSMALRNYIKNSEIERSVKGWVAYDDGAAVPVDCTGGTVDNVLSVQNTVKLRGDNSLQYNVTTAAVGEGFSYQFKLDPADANVGNSQRIEFDYQWEAPLQSEFSIYVYNVDSAKFEPVSQPSFDSIKNRLYSSFLPTVGDDDYRLCIHKSVGTSALDENYFDNFFVGHREAPQAIPGAQFVGSYRLDGATNCNFDRTGAGSDSYGNFTADSDCGAITVKGKATTAAGKIPGVTFSNLPAGKYKFIAYFNGVKIGSINGHTAFRLTDGTENGPGSLVYDGTNTYVLSPMSIPLEVEYATPQTSVTVQVQGLTVNTGNTVRIDEQAVDRSFFLSAYRYPTEEQSVSSDFGNRVVAFQATKTASAQLIPNSSVTRVTFGNVTEDTSVSWSSANNEFVVPEDGWYNMSANILYDTPNAGTAEMHLFGCGETVKTIISKGSGEWGQLPNGHDFNCKAGEKMYVNTFQSMGVASNLVSAVEFQRISIHKIQTPQTLFGNELVYSDKVVAQGDGGVNTVAEGFATPTGGNVVNINLLADATVYWMRIGKTFSAAVRFRMNAQSTGNFQAFLNLPSFVTNNFTDVSQCGGTVIGEVSGGAQPRTATISARSGTTQILIRSGLTDAPGDVIYNGSFVCRIQ